MRKGKVHDELVRAVEAGADGIILRTLRSDVRV